MDRRKKTQQRYNIIVHNRSGASDGRARLTSQEVNAYLKSWHDPQNLYATITNNSGDIIAIKPMGFKTIRWSK